MIPFSIEALKTKQMQNSAKSKITPHALNDPIFPQIGHLTAPNYIFHHYKLLLVDLKQLWKLLDTFPAHRRKFKVLFM